MPSPAASLDNGGHILRSPELPLPAPRPLIPRSSCPSIGFLKDDWPDEEEQEDEAECTRLKKSSKSRKEGKNRKKPQSREREAIAKELNSLAKEKEREALAKE